MGLTFYEAGITPEPQVGSYIELDTQANYHVGDSLESCDDWDKAEFRFPVTSLRIPYAVNVKVTGRTLQRRGGFGARWVRVQMTFVGDGEPDQTRSGWMVVD